MNCHATDAPSMPLSTATRALWAKTGNGEQSHLWEPLYVHLADTAEVMRVLWRSWVAPHCRHIICEASGQDDPDALEPFVCFIAGVHDIGKAHPGFQSKVPDRWEHVQETGLGSSGALTGRRYLHAGAGEIILRNWLVNDCQIDVNTACGWASIVGNHHGSAPSDSAVAHFEGTVPLLDTSQEAAWSATRRELLEWVASHTLGSEACGGKLAAIPHIEAKGQILLAGMLIMADWIASNQAICPLVDGLASWSEAAIRAERAIASISLPSPWLPEVTDDDDLFHSRFPDLPADAEPRPMQRLAMEVARKCDMAPLVIIEDSMGNGKTEASLLAAEILARRYGCSGVAYFLPTQATTDAMYARVSQWLSQVVGVNGANGERQSIRLMHGKAMLNESYRRLCERTAWIGDDAGMDESVVANAWLNGNKRGFLSPFVVGTIDQLLRAALNAKHVHLWHLGMASKVVIIDEVHAYDAYMGVYLNTVLSYLGMYGVPTILLSATCPASRRKEMMYAYQGAFSTRARRRIQIHDVEPLADGHRPYPMLTVEESRRRSMPTYMHCTSNERHSDVLVEPLPDDMETLYRFLQQELSDGGCACVIRNTVRRAQETYGVLAEQFGEDVIMVHARFVSSDRARNDARLLALFGKNAKRPQRIIVVATQVVEQSLDIDFDIIISDIAPIDLLLQRAGRLHRHMRGEGQSERPKRLRNARMLITGMEQQEGMPPSIDSGIRLVYEESILLRTILVLWNDRYNGKRVVCIPQDIPDLVSKVYDAGIPIPTAWQSKMDEADERMRQRRERKEQKANTHRLRMVTSNTCSLDGWMDAAMPMPGEIQGGMAVRDIEDSVTATLAVLSESGRAIPVAWHQDWSSEPDGSSEQEDSRWWKSLGESPEMRLASDTISLPLSLSRLNRTSLWEAACDTFTKANCKIPILGDDIMPILLDDGGMAVLNVDDAVYSVCYSRATGLSVTKQSDSDVW